MYICVKCHLWSELGNMFYLPSHETVRLGLFKCTFHYICDGNLAHFLWPFLGHKEAEFAFLSFIVRSMAFNQECFFILSSLCDTWPRPCCAEMSIGLGPYYPCQLVSVQIRKNHIKNMNRSPIWGPRHLQKECAHPHGWRDKNKQTIRINSI